MMYSNVCLTCRETLPLSGLYRPEVHKHLKLSINCRGGWQEKVELTWWLGCRGGWPGSAGGWQPNSRSRLLGPNSGSHTKLKQLSYPYPSSLNERRGYPFLILCLWKKTTLSHPFYLTWERNITLSVSPQMIRRQPFFTILELRLERR